LSEAVLIYSIDVMLSQLPPHTVSKKIENYEHLDLLWGERVDKDVFPHVQDYLKAYAEQRIEETHGLGIKGTEEIPSHPPAYSNMDATGLQRRD